MTGDSALSAYVEICRGFGLSNDEIRAIHAGGSVPDDVDPRMVIAKALPDDPSASDAHRALLKVLSNASRGIDAPREYDQSEVGTQLDAVLSAIGGSVSVEDAEGNALTAGGPNPAPWTINVADPSGNVRNVAFSYPPHDLGDSNYPAILDAIEETVLDGAPLTFVRLADATRWRFVLVNESNLEALQANLGDDLRFAGGPLLAAEQLAAFVPDAQAADADADDSPDEIPQDQEEEAIGNLLTTDERIDDILATDDAPAETEGDSTSPVDESLDDVFASMESQIAESGEPIDAGASPFEPADPEPATEPASQPEAASQPASEPEPAAEPEPEPAAEPEPEPAAMPEPAARPEATSASEPAREVEPASESQPEPEPEPESEPATEAEPAEAARTTSGSGSAAAVDTDPATASSTDEEKVDAEPVDSEPVEAEPAGSESDEPEPESAPAAEPDPGPEPEPEVELESPEDSEPAAADAEDAELEPVESPVESESASAGIEGVDGAESMPVSEPDVESDEGTMVETESETQDSAVTEAEPADEPPTATDSPAAAESADATTVDESAGATADMDAIADADAITDAEADADTTADADADATATADADGSSKGVVGRFVGWLKNVF